MHRGSGHVNRESRYFSPDVIQAVALPDRIIKAYFEDGHIRCYDMKPVIAEGGVFKRLEGDDFFFGRITVMNQTVAWDVTGDRDPYQCIDIAPETIFHDGWKVLD